MKNIVFVTRVLGVVRQKSFIDLNKVFAIELPDDDVFKIHFDSTVWSILAEEFDYVMRYWEPSYNTIKPYNDYKSGD